jgi:hypothetical protein
MDVTVRSSAKASSGRAKTFPGVTALAVVSIVTTNPSKRRNELTIFMGENAGLSNHVIRRLKFVASLACPP